MGPKQEKKKRASYFGGSGKKAALLPALEERVLVSLALVYDFLNARVKSSPWLYRDGGSKKAQMAVAVAIREGTIGAQLAGGRLDLDGDVPAVCAAVKQTLASHAPITGYGHYGAFLDAGGSADALRAACGSTLAPVMARALHESRRWRDRALAAEEELRRERSASPRRDEELHRWRRRALEAEERARSDGEAAGSPVASPPPPPRDDLGSSANFSAAAASVGTLSTADVAQLLACQAQTLGDEIRATIKELVGGGAAPRLLAAAPPLAAAAPPGAPGAAGGSPPRGAPEATARAARDEFAALMESQTRIAVWNSTAGSGGPGETSNLSSSVTSKSIWVIFGRIHCSPRGIEA